MTGGFLFTSQGQNAQATTTYTPVYSDDFSADSGDWITTGTAWTIGSGSAIAPNTGGDNKPLVRPTSEDFKDGKAEFTFTTGTHNTANMLVARYINDAGLENYYYAWFWQTSNNIRIAKVINNSAVTLEVNVLASELAGVPVDGKCEFIVESNSPIETQLTANCYDTMNQKVATATTTDSTSTLQNAGSWGLNSVNQGAFEDFATYKQTSLPEANSLEAISQTVKTGQSTTLTITGVSSEQTVTLSDGDADGVFGTSNIILNSGNEYTATTTYTPSAIGRATITASFADGSTQIATILASPYSTRIGFIGDSITNADYIVGTPTATETEIGLLGSGYALDNQAVNSSTTASWLSTLLEPTLSDFQANDVDIVQIMLGTNDAVARVQEAVYLDNLGNIITSLKSAGVKKVILNAPIFGGFNADDAQYMAAYGVALKTLVDGETVLLGDMDAYSEFEQHCVSSCSDSWYLDVLHPNDLGQVKLGEFWALAYERVIIEPLTTSHQFTGASDDEYAIDSVAGLEYTVDKDFSWFNVQTGQFANVLVDNDIVDPVDYTATSGSTVINLLPTYLNTLTTGSHTLTVRFTDGVSFSSAFSVLAANTGGNNGGNTGGNTGGGSTNPSTPFSPSVPNTGISNLGKLLAENRSVAMAVLGIVIAGLGISIALVGRKLAKES